MVVDDVSVDTEPYGVIVSLVRAHKGSPLDASSLQDAQEIAPHVAGR